MLSIRSLGRHEEAPWPLLRDADPSDAHIADVLARGTCVIAELDEQVIGEYVLIPTRPATVELVNLAVAPEHRGQGIGKRLLAHAIDVARQTGAHTLELGTGNSSLAQLALYQRIGFRLVGIERDYFERHYDAPIWENGIRCRDMVRLAFDLTPPAPSAS